jgi:Leucine-rich repeat (LRR) protein
MASYFFPFFFFSSRFFFLPPFKMLNNNELVVLPALHPALPLHSLDASHNRLTVLSPSIGALARLADLSLHHNKLDTLPPEIQRLTSLVRLDLRCNALRRPPPLAKAAVLRELLLGGNGLVSMGGFVALPPTLQILDVRDNQLSSLDGLRAITSLTRLDAGNNNIADFVEAARLPKLANIVVDGNPLRNLRPAVVAKGSQAILAFLKTQLPENEVPGACPTQPAGTGIIGQAAGSLAASAAALPEGVKWNACSGRGLAVVPADTWQTVLAAHPVAIDLVGNKLTAWPAELSGAAASLTELKLGNNLLAGGLPAAVGMLVNLISLGKAVGWFV